MPSFEDTDIMRVECDGHVLLLIPWRNQYVFTLLFAQFDSYSTSSVVDLLCSCDNNQWYRQTTYNWAGDLDSEKQSRNPHH